MGDQDLGLSFGAVADTYLLELFATTSSIVALPVDERAALVRDVRAQLEGPHGLPIRHEPTWTRLA